MADVLHKTTLEFRPSVNTPDYDPTDWVIGPGPDRASIQAIPQRYRKLDADGVTVLEMSQAEKDSVDAALDAARKLATPAKVTLRSPDNSNWDISISDLGAVVVAKV